MTKILENQQFTFAIGALPGNHFLSGSTSASLILCREIAPEDIDGVLNLLAAGFPARSRDSWQRVLKRLSEHPTPPGFPTYGYLLESEHRPVGVLLLIPTAIQIGGVARIRCNVSSWYVEHKFRVYASMLVSRALKDEHVTYTNLTPADHTRPILEAQGYQSYCHGKFVAVPALHFARCGATISPVTPGMEPDQDLPASEITLLLSHAGYGCISVVCRVGNHLYPFVFMPLRREYRPNLVPGRVGAIPAVHLIYCRHVDDFSRFAGPLGRFLARRGFPLVVIDANGPIAHLIGRYRETKSKYFKGPDCPRLGDLAYSELVMFDL